MTAAAPAFTPASPSPSSAPLALLEVLDRDGRVRQSLRVAAWPLRIGRATRGQQVAEFKTMVRELHAAGIEVILDVVYNHTAEGNHLGPMLSFKGVDNPAYYRLDPNDLTQYVLGVSRHETAVRGATPSIADARHPQVMAAIERVIAAAKRHAVPVSVCGEAAADPETARKFIDLGVDSLSASPALLPQLRMTLLADSFGF